MRVPNFRDSGGSGGGSGIVAANHAFIYRYSDTQIRVYGKDILDYNYIYINEENVSLKDLGSSAIHNIIVKNLLSSTGTDSGSVPSAPGVYHIYASNSKSTFAPNDVYISTVAPQSNGYLGTAGNALNWRYVGSVYLKLDTTLKIWDNLSVVSVNTETVKIPLTGNEVRGSGSNNWHAWPVQGNSNRTEFYPVLAPQMFMYMVADAYAYNNNGQVGLRLLKNGLINPQAPLKGSWESRVRCMFTYHYQNISPTIYEAHECELEYWFYTGSCTMYGDNSSVTVRRGFFI